MGFAHACTAQQPYPKWSKSHSCAKNQRLRKHSKTSRRIDFWILFGDKYGGRKSAKVRPAKERGEEDDKQTQSWPTLSAMSNKGCRILCIHAGYPNIYILDSFLRWNHWMDKGVSIMGLKYEEKGFERCGNPILNGEEIEEFGKKFKAIEKGHINMSSR